MYVLCQVKSMRLLTYIFMCFVVFHDDNHNDNTNEIELRIVPKDDRKQDTCTPNTIEKREELNSVFRDTDEAAAAAKKKSVLLFIYPPENMYG